MDGNALKEIKCYLKLRAKAQETNNLKEESECCNVLGHEYFKIGDLDNALAMHKSELQLSLAIHDTTGAAVAYRKLGDVYVAMRKFSEAIDNHSKHMKMSKGNDLELQRAYTSLGRTYLVYGQGFDDNREAKEAYVKSIELLKESLRVVTRLKDNNTVSQKETNEMKVRSLINLGLCFHHLSRSVKSKEKSVATGKSKEFFEKALYLAKKFNFKEDLYLANFILGTVNLDQKQYSSALRHVEEAMVYAKAMNRSDFLLEASELCTRIHLLMENAEAAKLFYKKLYKRNIQSRDAIRPRLQAIIKICHISSQIASNEPDTEKLCHLHEALADIYCNMACYCPAIKHYKLQAELLDRLSTASSKQKRTALFSIASTLADAEEYKEAIEYYKKEIASTLDKTERCKTLSHIADCMEKMEADYHEIVAVFEKALTYATEAKDDMLTLRTLAAFEVLQKNFNDRQNRSKTKSAIAELELKLDVCVDEVLANDADESFQNTCSLEDSEELLERELQLSDEDDSDRDEPVRRRRRTNFNKTNEKGETLLHRACIDGQLKSVEVLIRQGHPVDPKDFCGWIPLHEACNRGYADIARYLIKHGANINDTGGQYCDNITPINDAAINGHFDLMEIMLDAGANPNIPSAQGKTALDSLVYYYHQHKEDLDSASRNEYKRLYKRLKSLADLPAEQPYPKSSQSPSALVPECDDGRPTSTARLKELDDNIPVMHRDRTRTSLSSYLKSVSKKHNNRCSVDIDSDSSDDGVRRFSSRTQSKNDLKSKKSIKNRYDDDIPDIVRRRNRKNPDSNRSKFPKSSSKTLGDALAFEDEILSDSDWMIPDDVDNFTQPMKKHKRASAQLNPTDLPLDEGGVFETQINQSQAVISETSHTATVTQQVSAAFRLRVKINDQAFIVVVPGRAQTVAWLTEKAAQRYEEVAKMKPVLSLSTSDGCLLSPDDAVYDVLSSNDIVLAKVESWNIVPLTKKYSETCLKESAPELPLVKQACEICQTTNTLQLLNLGYSYQHHLKPLIMCLRQQNIDKIVLPGNSLDSNGLSSLCAILSAPSPTPLCTLVELNLTCCNLTDDSLHAMVSCTPLHEVKVLNLSFNLLENGVNLLKYLSKLDKLKELNLKSCWLTEKFFQEVETLAKSFENVEHINLSRNAIKASYLAKLLAILNRSRLKTLLLSDVTKSPVNTSFISVLVDYIAKTQDKLKLIDISSNELSNEQTTRLRHIEHLSTKFFI